MSRHRKQRSSGGYRLVLAGVAAAVVIAFVLNLALSRLNPQPADEQTAYVP
ncbi:MAG: hypothetical protein H0X18_18645, partial [Geodermatophilaceae bacterium]|nr:hypothetical protein [Geodermatophilaceae bacterium]